MEPSTSPEDSTDRHVERWLPVLPELDADIEGAVTRMLVVTKHLRRVRERSLVEFDLQKHEHDTLHALAGRGGGATPSELVHDLDLAPASVTGRLEALERRDFVRRTPSRADRRRVDVQLTESGWQAWRQAIAVVGREEHRILAALDPDERRLLSDLLRRVVLRIEE
ncbi:MarR family transcriptional regulator [Kitasatospora sp. NBC_01287]|uniref:MarR family winged helix-turn-helix transcriptional regulator n=1 Tax=Kitasatospora sp. NBC_01287 TaxID=2903573 RepID=UPI00225838B0|nr:MarR family transcriptional regulator [Kitasatospora sp. NBC_01287]MCX4744592.1 MarR family transcriptional regulator [Kitasatospora sp. NBC_01287]